MPGDTKVHQTNQGWIDDDNPNTHYSARRLARDARRKARGDTTTTTKQTVKVKTHTVVGFKHSTTGIPAGNQTLTSLQEKLLKRMTDKQNVQEADAIDIITSNGYNKAASYGHMRAAGATHAEATIVIGLSSPDVSVAYGKARANGLNHILALSEALKCQANG